MSAGCPHQIFDLYPLTRELAFLSAVEAENLDSSRCPVINDYKIPQEAVALVLQNPSTPSVICVENDALAAELYKEFTRLGVKLPEDLSLIGFDDQELASIIDLSTIRQEPTALGKEAVNLAVSVLSGSSGSISSNPQGSVENKKFLQQS